MLPALVTFSPCSGKATRNMIVWSLLSKPVCNFYDGDLISHSPLAKLLFPAVDSNLLKFLYDDNQKVEPEWYIPIIPMVLVNGAEGIGTGWACKIPNYDPREIVNNINRMLNHQDPLPLVKSLTKKSTAVTLQATWFTSYCFLSDWRVQLYNMIISKPCHTDLKFIQ